MSTFRRMLVFVIALAGLCTVATAQQLDQLAAARVLGPQWRQMARASGMVFAGTVLGVEALPARTDRELPAIAVKLRVEHAIAGVQPGQVVTIREWAGAWSSHRAMRTGQRMLLFFYLPSRLGLTSPVGGPMGQVALDPSGKNVAARAPVLMNDAMDSAMDNGAAHARQPRRVSAAQQRITVIQLKRAILNARRE